jgi:hypothetical protein
LQRVVFAGVTKKNRQLAINQWFRGRDSGSLGNPEIVNEFCDCGLQLPPLAAMLRLHTQKTPWSPTGNTTEQNDLKSNDQDHEIRANKEGKLTIVSISKKKIENWKPKETREWQKWKKSTRDRRKASKRLTASWNLANLGSKQGGSSSPG